MSSLSSLSSIVSNLGLYTKWKLSSWVTKLNDLKLSHHHFQFRLHNKGPGPCLQMLSEHLKTVSLPTYEVLQWSFFHFLLIWSIIKSSLVLLENEFKIEHFHSQGHCEATLTDVARPNTRSTFCSQLCFQTRKRSAHYCLIQEPMVIPGASEKMKNLPWAFILPYEGEKYNLNPHSPKGSLHFGQMTFFVGLQNDGSFLLLYPHCLLEAFPPGLNISIPSLLSNLNSNMLFVLPWQLTKIIFGLTFEFPKHLCMF